MKNLFRKKIVYKEIIKSDLRDFTEEEKELYAAVQSYTMTSPERIKALADSVKYILRQNIDGDFVECGVWKGGSIITMIKVLLSYGNIEKNIYLYDTFEGMSEPTINDIDTKGLYAKDRLVIEDKEESWIWAKAVIDEVKNNIYSESYPIEKLHFIVGKVEDTLTKKKPEKIALLRLDTDWYESTKVELEELYDNVVKGGIIIIDDYGHWKGCKKAVDEFLMSKKENIFLNRIDYTGRLIIKP
jgi:O-methyltransferase